MNLFIYYNLIAWKIMFIFYSEGRFKIFWPSAIAIALLSMPKAHLHRAFVSVTYSDVMLAFIIL
jgi:hypothetical protein